MAPIYIYTIAAFLAGFIIAWIIRSVTIAAYKKSNKSLGGFLESEKLRKETLLKENTSIHDSYKSRREELETRILQLQIANKRMDEDIILLQKSNEETEALLESGMPMVHNLKLQLIEANNTIARYKAQLDRLSEKV